jgi:hypothetical protein
MTKAKQSPKNIVVLTAFGSLDERIEEIRLSIDDYYEESSELIDSSSYRRMKKIQFINGEIYNSKGRLIQSFENRYNDAGALTWNRTVHEDGSVTEQAIEP